MIGQAVGYAASALGYVATAAGRPLLVREIAEACDIPGPYLAKIVNTLRRIGLVDTQRGVGGGVTLARPANQITLLELCRAMGDPIIDAKCMLGTAECSDSRACPAHAFWSRHRAEALKFLTNTTVADFAAFEARKRLGGRSPTRPASGRAATGDIGGAPAPIDPSTESLSGPT
jgi:Rrf2 family protein